jgi:hypothetical protein
MSPGAERVGRSPWVWAAVVAVCAVPVAYFVGRGDLGCRGGAATGGERATAVGRGAEVREPAPAFDGLAAEFRFADVERLVTRLPERVALAVPRTARGLVEVACPSLPAGARAAVDDRAVVVVALGTRPPDRPEPRALAVRLGTAGRAAPDRPGARLEGSVRPGPTFGPDVTFEEPDAAGRRWFADRAVNAYLDGDVLVCGVDRDGVEAAGAYAARTLLPAAEREASRGPEAKAKRGLDGAEVRLTREALSALGASIAEAVEGLARSWREAAEAAVAARGTPPDFGDPVAAVEALRARLALLAVAVGQAMGGRLWLRPVHDDAGGIEAGVQLDLRAGGALAEWVAARVETRRATLTRVPPGAALVAVLPARSGEDTGETGDEAEGAWLEAMLGGRSDAAVRLGAAGASAGPDAADRAAAATLARTFRSTRAVVLGSGPGGAYLVASGDAGAPSTVAIDRLLAMPWAAGALGRLLGCVGDRPRARAPAPVAVEAFTIHRRAICGAVEAARATVPVLDLAVPRATAAASAPREPGAGTNGSPWALGVGATPAGPTATPLESAAAETLRARLAPDRPDTAAEAAPSARGVHPALARLPDRALGYLALSPARTLAALARLTGRTRESVRDEATGSGTALPSDALLLVLARAEHGVRLELHATPEALDGALAAYAMVTRAAD